MYNRYIPREDGSYQRSRMQETAPPKRSEPPQPRQTPPPPPPEPVSPSYTPPRHSSPLGAADFLRKLLPNNLDIGDLLVIVLLLLMASDGKEDNNNALLTLAIYLMIQ